MPLLKKVFEDEKPACKLVIVEAFGRIGSKEALPLLDQYLSQINKMDFSVKHKGRRRSNNPHPNTLKNEVEQAIRVIEAKNI